METIWSRLHKAWLDIRDAAQAEIGKPIGAGRVVRLHELDRLRLQALAAIRDLCDKSRMSGETVRSILDPYFVALRGLLCWDSPAIPANVDPLKGRFIERFGAVQAAWTGIFELLVQAEGKVIDLPHTLPTPRSHRRGQCYDRDHLWLSWKRQGETPAKIRDRWNKDYTPHYGPKVTYDTVKEGLRKAGLEAAGKPTKPAAKRRKS